MTPELSVLLEACPYSTLWNAAYVRMFIANVM